MDTSGEKSSRLKLQIRCRRQKVRLWGGSRGCSKIRGEDRAVITTGDRGRSAVGGEVFKKMNHGGRERD